MDAGEMALRKEAGEEDTVDGHRQPAGTEAAPSVASESDSHNHFTRTEVRHESSPVAAASDGRPDEQGVTDSALEEGLREGISLNVSETSKERDFIDAGQDHVNDIRNVSQHIDENFSDASQNDQHSCGPDSREEDELSLSDAVPWEAESVDQIVGNPKTVHYGQMQGRSRISIHKNETANHKLEEFIHDDSPAAKNSSSVINMGRINSSKAPPPPPPPPLTLSALLKKMQLFLRCGNAMFSLIAFAVMFSTAETRVASGSTFHVKFSDFEAYNYLIALNMLSFLYSSGQAIIPFQLKRSTMYSPIREAALIYICDQMLAFLLISCSSSGATASGLSRSGLRNIWPPACSTWKLFVFCSKADSAIAMSFLASLFVMASSFVSGYNFAVIWAE